MWFLYDFILVLFILLLANNLNKLLFAAVALYRAIDAVC